MENVEKGFTRFHIYLAATIGLTLGGLSTVWDSVEWGTLTHSREFWYETLKLLSRFAICGYAVWASIRIEQLKKKLNERKK